MMTVLAVVMFAAHFALVTFLTWQPSRRLQGSASDRRKDPLFSLLGLIGAYLPLFGAQAVGLQNWLRSGGSVGRFWWGFVIFAAGFALRVWAVRTLGRFFTMEIGIRPDHRIVDTGPYAWVRHPSYTGYILIVAGIGIAYDSWSAFAIPVGLTVLFLALRIPQEEQMLRSSLGEEYVRYCSRTKRLLPFLF